MDGLIALFTIAFVIALVVAYKAYADKQAALSEIDWKRTDAYLEIELAKKSAAKEIEEKERIVKAANEANQKQLEGIKTVLDVLAKKEEALKEKERVFNISCYEKRRKVESDLKEEERIFKVSCDEIKERIVSEYNEKKRKREFEFEEREKIFNTVCDERKRRIESELEERERIFETLCAEKTIGFPWLAGKMAEFYTAKERGIAEYLAARNPPAPRKAKDFKVYASEKKEQEEKAQTYKYQLEYYESLFPWLAEYREAPDEIICQNGDNDDNEEDDPAFKFFLKSEVDKLSRSELFQKALDRYVARRKSNWEIGRDFERYIGYQYEAKGYDVKYFGATEKLEDMGRDLIVKGPDGGTGIIQCKYWARDKTIHEKHIFQLFGTAVMYAVSKVGMSPGGAFATLNAAKVSPIFVCTCSLSYTAKNMAKGLGVKVREQLAFDPEYPRIKCNVGKENELIYHLPFDQMYDKVKIKLQNEFYAKTIVEAEAKGFRRAWRWRGNN
jgi:hypothetical protein